MRSAAVGGFVRDNTTLRRWKLWRPNRWNVEARSTSRYRSRLQLTCTFFALIIAAIINLVTFSSVAYATDRAGDDTDIWRQALCSTYVERFEAREKKRRIVESEIALNTALAASLRALPGTPPARGADMAAELAGATERYVASISVEHTRPYITIDSKYAKESREILSRYPESLTDLTTRSCADENWISGVPNSVVGALGAFVVFCFGACVLACREGSGGGGIRRPPDSTVSSNYFPRYIPHSCTNGMISAGQACSICLNRHEF